MQEHCAELYVRARAGLRSSRRAGPSHQSRRDRAADETPHWIQPHHLPVEPRFRARTSHQNDRLESDALPAFRSRRSSRSPAAANPLDTAHYATAWLRREPFRLDELAGLVPVILLGNARTGGEPAHGVPAGGSKTVSVTPSAMLRKLGAYRQQNRLYLALGEIGRIERTLFMLQAGLNKGEARHALARAVFAHAQGRVHDRSHEAQQKRVMALNLVIAAIVYWNTAYIEKAATHLRRERRLPDPTLLRHVSPLGWEHIVLTGDYDWNSGAAERTNARPLNLYPARIRA